MLSYGVFTPNELDASNRSRPSGNSVDGNTGVSSLRRFWRDHGIVVIKAQWYRTVTDVVTSGPLNQRVPNPIVFGEGRRNLRIRSNMHDGQEVRGAQRFKVYFGQTATIATE